MKDRDLASPDQGDALALCFAKPVVAKLRAKHKEGRRQRFAGRSSTSSGKGSLDSMSSITQ